MKEKVKNVFLILCLFITNIAIITKLSGDNYYGNDEVTTAFFLSIFTTPLIIYVWNKLIKK